MRVWGKTSDERKGLSSVARAAAEGQSLQALLKEAVAILLASDAADRVGIWVESSSDASEEVNSFRGMVAEKEKDATPAGWSRLSPTPPLPADLLAGLQTVEQELGDSRDALMIGPLVEMRRALWVPIQTHGHLRGVVFAANRKKHAPLPRVLLESVAAELALTMQLEDERSLGRERQADSRRALAAFTGSESSDEILNAVAKDCTQSSANQNVPAAVFAAIGLRIDSPLASGSPLPASTPNVRFNWHSGSAAWICALENEEIRSLWRQALESQHVVGREPANASSLEPVSRVVALPLLAAGHSLGVLVVGLRRGGATLAALERLELNAALAASVLLQQKRSEQAAAQEMQQNALLAGIAAATLLVHADGAIVQYSDSARALLDLPLPEFPSDAPPENFFALCSEKGAPLAKAWMHQVFSLDPAIQHANEILPELPLRNGIRVRLQSLGCATDGAVSVLLERLPRDAEQAPSAHGLPEILHVIEWLEEGVVLFGAQQEIRAVNSRFGQLVGLTPGELARLKSLDDLVSSLAARTADAGAFAESWHRLARGTDGAVREELQFVRPVARLLERATRPILDAKGSLVGRIEIYRDLTAQRIFQSKLLHTDKLAELGQMVTGVAHELSSPLTSILGYAQRLLLHRDPLGDSYEARQIFQEAERATAILRQLLLSARESRPERRRVALNQIVSRALELQRFNLAGDRIHVQLDLEPVLPFVLGDAGQLQQVLMNLLGNARHAIEEQGQSGTIRIKTTRISEKRVLLEVSDDGSGIPQSIQARIFDPFFTTKPPGMGTGLGLSIVLGIVREHGGRLHLTSNLGQGTTFSIEFPAMTASEMSSAADDISLPATVEALPPAPPFAAAPPAGALAPWAGTRVLVLEDEPTVARLIADVLEDEGLRVDILLDSRQALDRAASEQYALAICDMKMPELDGEHFYQALARTKNPLRNRFLFVTGDVLAAHTRDFLERYHLPYVAKPFRVEELTEKIRGVLDATFPREPSHVSAGKKNAARP